MLGSSKHLRDNRTFADTTASHKLIPVLIQKLQNKTKMMAQNTCCYNAQQPLNNKNKTDG